MSISRKLWSKARRINLQSQMPVNLNSGNINNSKKVLGGLNFHEHRLYTAGDDPRLIDWKVSSRFGGELYQKVYHDDISPSIILMVDISSSNNTGQTQKKRELIAEILCTLIYSAICQESPVGLILFNYSVVQYIPPSGGKNNAFYLLDQYFEYSDQEFQTTDISIALKFLTRVLKKRSLVILISDFISEDFSHELRISKIQHEMRLIRIKYENEFQLPPVGLVRIKDPETGKVLLVDSNNQNFQKHWQEKHSIFANRQKTFLNNQQIPILDLELDHDYYLKLANFFSLKPT